MSRFAEELRALRKKRGMSLRELASATGMDFTYINKLENDRANPPSDEKIQRLCDILMCDADSLTLLAGRVPERQAEMEAEDGLMVKFLKALPNFSAKERASLSKKFSAIAMK